MKKTLLAVALTAASGMASADMLLGGDIEANLWQQTHEYDGASAGSDDVSLTFEASFEHPIPLIPNVKFAHSSVDNSKYAYTKRDFTLYYEFLDNDLVSFDLGVGLSQYTDGELKASIASLSVTETFEGYLPHVYGAVKVGVPFTPLSFYAKGNGIGYADSHVIDAQIGAQFEIPVFFAFDIELQAGYRMQELSLGSYDDLSVDLETNTSGVFVGVNIDF
jgi:outer membrane protein